MINPIIKDIKQIINGRTKDLPLINPITNDCSPHTNANKEDVTPIIQPCLELSTSPENIAR